MFCFPIYNTLAPKTPLKAHPLAHSLQTHFCFGLCHSLRNMAHTGLKLSLKFPQPFNTKRKLPPPQTPKRFLLLCSYGPFLPFPSLVPWSPVFSGPACLVFTTCSPHINSLCHENTPGLEVLFLL